MQPCFFIILLLLFNQVFCIENYTNKTDEQDEEIIQKSINTDSLVSRQRGYGLVTFEDQPNPTHFEDERDDNTYGLINFDDQPSNRPLRFEYANSGSPGYDNHEQPSNRPLRFEYANSGSPGYDNHDQPSNKPLRFENANYGSPGYDNQHDFSGLGNQRPSFHDFNKQGQHTNTQSDNGIVFQDDNKIENNQQVQKPGKKKRRRRRRKPKQQFPGQGYGFAPVLHEQQGYALATGDINQQGYGFARPGSPLRPDQGVPGRPNPIYPGGQFYRPHRRRKLSIAEEALSSITSALTSIARYDDFQCVPRLLCEVAGGNAPGAGGVAASGSGVLQTIVNLQPLVTLLAAYNGISSSPLFVFGRAAILGMTSKGNAGTCRYAYPLCPNDPEKLVEYLNNHNGGFFRFFNGPQYQGQQNLEQFYNHLSNIPQGLAQNYGQYPNSQQQFGLPQQQIIGQQNYGSYPEQQNYGFQSHNQGHGTPNPTFYQPNPGLYQNGYGQNYGNGFPYQHNNGYGFSNQRFKNNKKEEDDYNKIEKRIQNIPDVTYVDSNLDDAADDAVKWSFPEKPSLDAVADDKQRLGRTVKFPDKHYSGYENIPSYAEFVRKAKGFNFPDKQSNRQYVNYYNYSSYAQITNNSKLKLDENGFYVEDNKQNAYDDDKEDEGIQTVYVVRGNGDPNHPEVVKLRPGQKLQ